MNIDQNKCIGCQQCKMSCPAMAISVNSAGKCEIDMSKCLQCHQCMSLCPMGAISAN